MKIHCIETGKVKVKRNQVRKGKEPAPGLLKVIIGKKWSDWLPIYAWVIEHPEGIIVVDTGETHKTKIDGYLPKWHPYYKTSVKFDVNPEDEIGPKLREMGIDPAKDVSKVIITHLHTDHAGGLYHFPGSAIYVNRKEYTGARGLQGILKGYLPHRWPDWFHPHFFNFGPIDCGPFKLGQKLTKDGKVIILPTPGHVANHASVLAIDDDIQYFIAGDTSYTQELMLAGIPDGVGTKATIQTLHKIKQLGNERPLVYLPSHDPESHKRLIWNKVINNNTTGVAV